MEKTKIIKHIIVITFFIASISSLSFAGETIVSYVEWIIPGTKADSLICELSRGPEHIMQGALRCYINTSKEGNLKKGKEVFIYRDDSRSPISVTPALGPVSNTLITMWESAAYACYIVFGYHNGKVEKLFEHCSKGGIETVDDGSDGIIFLVTDYSAFQPTDTTIYHWSAGIIGKKKIPYNERLNEVKKLQTEQNAGVQGTAQKPPRP